MSEKSSIVMQLDDVKEQTKEHSVSNAKSEQDVLQTSILVQMSKAPDQHSQSNVTASFTKIVSE